MSNDRDKDSDRTASMRDPEDRPDRPRLERLGYFRIEATLGAGGMRTVYRAYDESMKRPVAHEMCAQVSEIGAYTVFTTNTITDLRDDDHGGILTCRFEVSQNYPNPFNSVTTIEYGVLRAGKD